jgi:hypothetical protein
MVSTRKRSVYRRHSEGRRAMPHGQPEFMQNHVPAQGGRAHNTVLNPER